MSKDGMFYPGKTSKIVQGWRLWPWSSRRYRGKCWQKMPDNKYISYLVKAAIWCWPLLTSIKALIELGSRVQMCSPRPFCLSAPISMTVGLEDGSHSRISIVADTPKLASSAPTINQSSHPKLLTRKMREYIRQSTKRHATEEIVIDATMDRYPDDILCN